MLEITLKESQQRLDSNKFREWRFLSEKRRDREMGSNSQTGEKEVRVETREKLADEVPVEDPQNCNPSTNFTPLKEYRIGGRIFFESQKKGEN